MIKSGNTPSENKFQQLLTKLETDAIAAGLSREEIIQLKKDCRKVLMKE